ncbi:MAG: hypothetical protein V1921_01920 [Candidatus Altiarchaeota archaeon]
MFEIPVLFEVNEETYNNLTSLVLSPYVLIGITVLVFIVVYAIVRLLEKREGERKASKEFERMRPVRAPPPLAEKPAPEGELTPHDKLIKRERELRDREEELKIRKKKELEEREKKLGEKESEETFYDDRNRDANLDIVGREPADVKEDGPGLDDESTELEYSRNRLWKSLRNAEEKYVNDEMDEEEFRRITAKNMRELIEVNTRLKKIDRL